MSVSRNYSLLLSAALLFMIQLLPSIRAAPVSCKNNSGETEKLYSLSLVLVTDDNDLTFYPITAKNCAELYTRGQTISGVYTIDPDGKGAFDVYCDQITTGGGWTVIQKRQSGSVDFNRTWKDYTKGFGDFLIGEFWLGLNKINRLTQNETENKLRVDLGACNMKAVYAEYASFGLGDKNSNYTMSLGNFLNCSVKRDGLKHHKGFSFGTWDRDPAGPGCVPKKGGGWWYSRKKCRKALHSNLNGIYRPVEVGRIYWAGLHPRRANCSAPTTTEMKIRPVNFT